MNAKEQLYAFYAVVAAVCFCVTIAAVLAYIGKLDASFATTITAAVTGLFALANAPRRNSQTVENADTVNQGGAGA